MIQPDWQSDDGSIRLFCGDCLQILPQLEADAMISDPPYGVGLGVGKDMRANGHGLAKVAYRGFCDTYEVFVGSVVPRINAGLDVSKRAAIFTGPHIHEQRKPDAIGGVYSSAASGRHRWGFKNLLPVLLYGTAPELNKGARFPTAIASNATACKVKHPCPKPLEWMEWLVNLASRDGEVVLDPFMGSGTTGVACVNTGRKFIGIEIDPGYFAIARDRIQAALRERQEQLIPA